MKSLLRAGCSEGVVGRRRLPCGEPVRREGDCWVRRVQFPGETVVSEEGCNARSEGGGLL